MSDIHYGRNVKGIKKQLSEKIDSWLESIEDKALRSEVRRCVIVSGGAIASMLMGDKVNDYDVYLTDYKVLLKLSEYYVKKWIILNDPKVFGEDNNLATHSIEKKSVVCNVGNIGILEEIASENQDIKYRPVAITENAITLSDDIQIITRFYGTAKEIHANFDFIHATCHWEHSDNKLITPVSALLSIISRNLVYQGSLYPIASIFRMKKFINRGWRINAGQQLKIMWQIHLLDLKNRKVLIDQLTGVDLLYMTALINAMKDIEPEKMDTDYVCKIIDTIFE